jgi:hypothetical protein
MAHESQAWGASCGSLDTVALPVTVVRYPIDLTDAKWALVEPMMIPPAKRGGRRREVNAGDSCVSTVRLPPEISAVVDNRASKQPDKIGRSEAICRLVEIGLKAKKT